MIRVQQAALNENQLKDVQRNCIIIHQNLQFHLTNFQDTLINSNTRCLMQRTD